MNTDLAPSSIKSYEHVEYDDNMNVSNETAGVCSEDSNIILSLFNDEYCSDYDEDSISSFDDTIVQAALSDIIFQDTEFCDESNKFGSIKRFQVCINIEKLELYSAVSDAISQMLKGSLGKRGKAVVSFFLQYRYYPHIHRENDSRSERNNIICPIHIIPSLHLTAKTLGEVELEKFIRTIKFRLPRSQKIMHSTDFSFTVDSNPTLEYDLCLIELVMKINPSQISRNHDLATDMQNEVVACAKVPLHGIVSEQSTSVHSKIDLRLLSSQKQGNIGGSSRKIKVGVSEAIGSIAVRITLPTKPECNAMDLRPPLGSNIHPVSPKVECKSLMSAEEKNEDIKITALSKSCARNENLGTTMWISLQIIKITGIHSSNDCLNLRVYCSSCALKPCHEDGIYSGERKSSDTFHDFYIHTNDTNSVDQQHVVKLPISAICTTENEHTELGDNHTEKKYVPLRFELWGMRRLVSQHDERENQQHTANDSTFFGAGVIPINIMDPDRGQSIIPQFIQTIDVKLSSPLPLPVYASLRTAVGTRIQIKMYPLLCSSAEIIQRAWRFQKENTIRLGLILRRMLNASSLSAINGGSESATIGQEPSLPIADNDSTFNSSQVAMAVNETKNIQRSFREGNIRHSNQAHITTKYLVTTLKGAEGGEISVPIDDDPKPNQTVMLYPPFHLCIRVGNVQGLREILTLWLEHNGLRYKWTNSDYDFMSDSLWLLSNALIVTFRVNSGSADFGWYAYSSNKRLLNDFLQDPNFNYQATAFCQLSDHFQRYLRSHSIIFTLWLIPSEMTEYDFQNNNEGEAVIPASAVKICHTHCPLHQLLDFKDRDYCMKCPWTLSFAESDESEVIGYVNISIGRLNKIENEITEATSTSTAYERNSCSIIKLASPDKGSQRNQSLMKEVNYTNLRDIQQPFAVNDHIGHFLKQDEIAPISGYEGSLDDNGDLVETSHKPVRNDELMNIIETRLVPLQEHEAIIGSSVTAVDANDEIDSWSERNLESVMASLDAVRLNLNLKANDTSRIGEVRRDPLLSERIDLFTSREIEVKMDVEHDKSMVPLQRTLSSVAANSIESLDQVCRELRSSKLLDSSPEKSLKVKMPRAQVKISSRHDEIVHKEQQLSSVAANSIESLDQVCRELRSSKLFDSSPEKSLKVKMPRAQVKIPSRHDEIVHKEQQLSSVAANSIESLDQVCRELRSSKLLDSSPLKSLKVKMPWTQAQLPSRHDEIVHKEQQLSSVAAINPIESLDQVCRELRSSKVLDSSPEKSLKVKMPWAQVKIPSRHDEIVHKEQQESCYYDHATSLRVLYGFHEAPKVDYYDSSSSSSEVFSRFTKPALSYTQTLGTRWYRKPVDTQRVFEPRPYQTQGSLKYQIQTPSLGAVNHGPRYSTMIMDRDRRHSHPRRFMHVLSSTSSSSPCSSPSSCSSASKIVEPSLTKPVQHGIEPNSISTIMDVYLRSHDRKKVRPSSAPSETKASRYQKIEK